MCAATALVKVMSLTPTPPGNALVSAEELDQPHAVYPLDLYFCTDCHHVQLGHVVDPRILYQNDYLYVSGTSSQFVKHLEDYATDMVGRFELKPQMLVSDIGSNDEPASASSSGRGCAWWAWIPPRRSPRRQRPPELRR